MNPANSCRNCGNPLPPPRRGRPVRYCSPECRRSAEFARRRDNRQFEAYKRGFRQWGETEVRKQLAEDTDFAEQLLELAEAYLGLPDGRERVTDDSEAIQVVFARQRSFGIIGHDNPLPNSADIDEAERTGDWAPMAWETYKSMTWQLANGFRPDMREWM